MLRCFIFVLVMMLVAGFSQVFAQIEVVKDSMSTNNKTTSDFSKKKLSAADSLHMAFQPIPKRAALYSAICPGLGQIYNRKYWKAPIVYAAIGTVTYFIALNYSGYNSVYKGIAQLEDNNPSNDNQPIIVRDFTLKKYDLSQTATLSDLLTIKKQFRQYLDESILAAAIIYVLNIVDANVDAHLYGFNATDNLAVAPIINQNGFGLAFTNSHSSKNKIWTAN